MARVFVIQLRRGIAFLLTLRLSEQRKLMSNRNAATRRSLRRLADPQKCGWVPMAILFFAVPVQYASCRFVGGGKDTLRASFAKVQG
jgi:hypothetical protein